jgi:Txe/YoeB family toxin of Txe-Axe toxin-antitoxin module
MFTINLFSVAVGAALTFIADYFFICIREKRNSNRVKEIIKAELLENKKAIELIQIELNKKINKSMLVSKMLEIKNKIIRDPFSYTAKDYFENKIGDLIFSIDYMISIMKLYNYLKKAEKVIIDTPSRYVGNDAENYYKKTNESIDVFKEEFKKIKF